MGGATDPVTLWFRTGSLAFTPDQFYRKGCIIFLFVGWLFIPIFEGIREYGKFNGQPPRTESRESYEYGTLPNLLLCCDPARRVSFAYASIQARDFEEEGETKADVVEKKLTQNAKWQKPTVMRTWYSNVQDWNVTAPWTKADVCVKFYTDSLVPKFQSKQAFSTSSIPRIYLDVTFEDHGLKPEVSKDFHDIWGGLDFWSEFQDGGKQFLSTVPSWGANDPGVWKGKLAVYSIEKKREKTLKHGSVASHGLSWRTFTPEENAKETKDKLDVITLNNRLAIAQPRVPDHKPETHVLPDLQGTLCKLPQHADAAFCKVPTEPKLSLSKLPSDSPQLRVVKVCLQATKMTVTEIEQESPRQRLWVYFSSVGGLWSFLGILLGICFSRKNAIAPPTDAHMRRIESDMETYEEMSLRWNSLLSTTPGAHTEA